MKSGAGGMSAFAMQWSVPPQKRSARVEGIEEEKIALPGLSLYILQAH